MTTIRTIAEANQALLPFVPLVSQLTGKDTTLKRIRPLMALLGNPQNKIKVVHIAGTSGKTSTAYFIAALLQASGKRIGLTVSPHVDTVTERVQLNGQPLEEVAFGAYLERFLEIVDQLADKPSYFELLYALSFWVFEQEAVDYAVVETGMGGLYDATNVVDRADKVCVITDIGFDHMHILGATIEAIATQKAGIIQPHNPVFMFRQSAAVNQVIEQRVRTQQAELHLLAADVTDQPTGNHFPADMPQYQQRNWQLAWAVAQYVVERDDLTLPDNAAQLVTQRLQVPGRMDRRQVGSKTVVMDGAHNGQKMRTFLASFERLYPGVRPALLIALKDGKEPADVAPLLAPLAGRIIITTFATSQDLPARSIDPNVLRAQFAAAGVSNIETIADQQQALQAALAGPEPVVIVTGSFYLLSQLRQSEPLQ